jgi:enoyl-CoA hydratase
MTEIVQSERHGAVALLLNRPKALNALSDDVLAALCAALDAAEAEDVRSMCCAAPGAFAAGADVAACASWRPASADR